MRINCPQMRKSWIWVTAVTSITCTILTLYNGLAQQVNGVLISKNDNPLAVLSQAGYKIIDEHSAKKIAEEFVGEKSIELQYKGIVSWGRTIGKGKACYHFKGPEDELLTVDVDRVSGVVHRFNWTRKAVEDKRILLSQNGALNKAKSLLKRLGFSDSEIFLRNANFYDRGFAGKEYVFRWGRIINAIEQPFSLRIEINATTGQVCNYLLIDHLVKQDLPIPKISQKTAQDLVLPYIELEKGWSWITSRLMVPMTPDQTLLWRLEAKGKILSKHTPHSGQTVTEVIQEFFINVETGDITRSQTFPVLADQPNIQIRPVVGQPKNISIIDRWPTWITTNTKEGIIKGTLIFESNRIAQVKNRPQDLQGEALRSALVSVNRDQMTALIALPVTPRIFSMNEEGRIAFEMRNGVCVLDLKAGAIGQVHDNRVWRAAPAWAAIRNVIAVIGNHGDGSSRGRDVFLIKIPENIRYLSMERQVYIPLEGMESLPVFNNKGDHLALFQYGPRSDKREANNSLFMAPVNTEQFSVGSPKKVFDNLYLPERATWFSDDRRLLISYSETELDAANPPEIVDLESKTRIPLNLPVLLDPDLPRGKPLAPREITVSPDGKQIAFSALRWSGDPKDDGTILIYTCDLDGKNLKRITPPENVPLEPYRYPQEGVTGLNAWEKLQPRPEPGGKFGLNDFEAREKYLNELRQRGREIRKQKAEEKKKAKVNSL